MATKLEDLTPEQDALCDRVAEEYIADLTAPRDPAVMPDMGAIERWLDVAYRLYDLPRPKRIEIVGSPFAALKLAGELTGEEHENTDWCGTGDGGWVSFYDYFGRIGVLTEEDKEAAEVRALRDFGREAWDSVLLDECAIVIRRPLAIVVDGEGRLHNDRGPCIEWADGEKDFSWHGIWVPERTIVDPRSYTRAEYEAITNTEERRALCEIAGWDWVAALLDARIVDTWTDVSTSLVYELLSHPGGKMLRKQSPALQNGSQPTYVEPVHEDLSTARAARKWQATDWTPTQCERDPALTYRTEA